MATKSSIDPMSGIRLVRIMVMGQTPEGQRSAGNIILGREAFTVSETQSERNDGWVAGRHLAVITTADLFAPNISEEEHSQGIRRCLGLSAPGPHVFLWVQQEGRITQEDREALRRFKESFGEGASRYSMVLLMHEDPKVFTDGDFARPGDGALQDFIQDCGGRYHLHSKRNHTQVTELLKKIQETVGENGGSYFTGEIFNWSDTALKGLKSKKKGVVSAEEPEEDVSTGKDSCQRSSLELEHPDMPRIRQVRIMLMGQTPEGQRSAGNIILGKEAFLDSETQKSERNDGLVAGRYLAVITTADLFTSNISEEERSQGVLRCLGLSAPGPHVFLWVQQEESITQEDLEALRRFKESFGEGASRYSMVLFMHDHKEYVTVGDSVRTLQDFIQDCGGRYHRHSKRNHTQVTELLEKIQEIVDENGGSYFTREIFKWSDIAWKGLKNKTKEVVSTEELKGVIAKRDTRERVRMVLVGKSGVGKSATGNTILGREALASKIQMYSTTKKCQKETGKVAGREVAVIDTPGLYDTSLSTEEVQLEIVKCMGLASPGPHVFLLVISVGHFTQVERETLQFIQTTFGDKAEKYTIVLFTRGDDLGDCSIEEYIAEGHPEVQRLIEDCGRRYHVFNNREKSDRRQVIDLFKKIEKMNWENGGRCYTCEMFQEAEKTMMRIQMKKEKEEEVKRELEMLEAKYKSEIEYMNRKVVEERELQERTKGEKDELIKLIQMEEQERREREEHQKRSVQDKELEALQARRTLLGRKAGDQEGREGASGIWRPDERVKKSQEVGPEEKQCKPEEKQCKPEEKQCKPEEKQEAGEEKSEKQKRIEEGKERKGIKISKFKKLEKRRQKVKENKKREEENTGEKKERSKRKHADKKDQKAEKPTNKRKSAKSDDIKSQGGEESDRPVMELRDSEKKQGEKKEQDEDSATEQNEEVRLTEEEYLRLRSEMRKKKEDLAKQQADAEAEFKSFIKKHPDHFEALPKNKGKRCVVQ